MEELAEVLRHIFDTLVGFFTNPGVLISGAIVAIIVMAFVLIKPTIPDCNPIEGQAWSVVGLGDMTVRYSNSANTSLYPTDEGLVRTWSDSNVISVRTKLFCESATLNLVVSE